MKKGSNKDLVVFTTGLLIAVPFIVFAQLGGASTTRQQIREDRKEVRQENRQDRQELRKAVGDQLREVQGTIQADREALKTEIKGLAREEAKKRLEEFRKESEVKREEVHTEIKSERDAFKAKANERRDELQKKIGDAKAQQVENYFTQMMNRMDAAVDRLDKLADRIESRLNKIQGAGQDITEPLAALDTARVSIAAVHTAITDAKAKFTDLSTSNTPQEQFAAIKELVNTVKTKSKEAHAALVEVISSIKRGKLDVEATTTPKTQ